MHQRPRETLSSLRALREPQRPQIQNHQRGSGTNGGKGRGVPWFQSAQAGLRHAHQQQRVQGRNRAKDQSGKGPNRIRDKEKVRPNLLKRQIGIKESLRRRSQKF